MRVREPAQSPATYRICFVCTSNICRSVAAELMTEGMLRASGLDEKVGLLSASTSRWSHGDEMDPRVVEWLARRGYEGAEHRARQFDAAWFGDVDLVVALDRTHRRTLWNWARGERDRAKIALLLSFDPELAPLQDVPDPYFSEDPVFDRVLETVEQACRSLVAHVRDRVDSDGSAPRIPL